MQPAIESGALVDVPLGQALVKKKIITKDDLDLALKIQRVRKNEYLGEILQSMGVSQEQINKTLDYLNKRKKIGDISIDLKLITPADLEHALEEQQQIQATKGIRSPLGILFYQMGLIKYGEYMTLLSKHFVLEIVSPEGFKVHPSLQDILSKRYMYQNKILVVGRNEQTYKIALGEPTTSLMQEIRKSIPPHMEIIFCLAHPLEVESVHNKMFEFLSMSRDI